MLASPSHAIIGSSDPGRLAAFLANFGLETLSRGRLPAESAAVLYGIEKDLDELLVGVPGAPNGYLRILSTPQPAPAFGPFDQRGLALDFYTIDLDVSRKIAEEAGARCHETVGYEAGPVTVREFEAVGPDGVLVVFIEANHRRSSVLDQWPDRVHSELHSVVWIVEDADEPLAFWTGQAGLVTLIDVPFGGKVVSKLMNLPKEDTPVRFIALSDESGAPARLEMLQFTSETSPYAAPEVLSPGFHAIGFHVPDLDAACARLTACEFGPQVRFNGERHSRARAVAGVAPGGIRIELWQE